MSRRDIDYLRYIQIRIEHVQRWSDVGFVAMMEDDIRYEAVLRRLETLANAASHLSDNHKDLHPEIPWRRISVFRNVLARG